MIEKDKTEDWYKRPPEVGIWINGKIREGARVLEIGPGIKPFFKATHFIDAYFDQGYARTDLLGGGVHVSCNVDVETIPFPDKYFDFVFSSHVLEDLRYPMRACAEMSRVAKAGFSTTPSPLVEFCRGAQSVWRGHLHHHWFVYPSDGVLHFLNKNVSVEYAEFPQEEMLEQIILKSPWLAHSYYYWEGEMKTAEVNVPRYGDYPGLVMEAVKDGMVSTKDFLAGIL